MANGKLSAISESPQRARASAALALKLSTIKNRVGCMFGCLVQLISDLLPEDLIDARVVRLRDAQPICDVGFAAKSPRADGDQRSSDR